MELFRSSPTERSDLHKLHFTDEVGTQVNTHHVGRSGSTTSPGMRREPKTRGRFGASASTSSTSAESSTAAAEAPSTGVLSPAAAEAAADAPSPGPAREAGGEPSQGEAGAPKPAEAEVAAGAPSPGAAEEPVPATPLPAAANPRPFESVSRTTASSKAPSSPSSRERASGPSTPWQSRIASSFRTGPRGARARHPRGRACSGAPRPAPPTDTTKQRCWAGLLCPQVAHPTIVHQPRERKGK